MLWDVVWLDGAWRCVVTHVLTINPIVAVGLGYRCPSHAPRLSLHFGANQDSLPKTMARGRTADNDDDAEDVRLTADTATTENALKSESSAGNEAYPTYKSVFKPLSALAWPMLLTYLCNFIIPVISVSSH